MFLASLRSYRFLLSVGLPAVFLTKEAGKPRKHISMQRTMRLKQLSISADEQNSYICCFNYVKFRRSKNMKKVILLTVVLLVAFAGSVQIQAQSIKEDISKEAKKAEKEAKKLEQKMREEYQYTEAVQALKNQEFVLEADRVIFKRGRSAFVTPNTNFIALSDGYATVQVAFDGPYSGPNGLGGVTVDGRASNIDMKVDKKGNVSFSMNVTGARVSAQVNIQLYNGNNMASVTISPNFNSNRITLNGALLPVDKSNVFKGRSF